MIVVAVPHVHDGQALRVVILNDRQTPKMPETTVHSGCSSRTTTRRDQVGSVTRHEVESHYLVDIRCVVNGRIGFVKAAPQSPSERVTRWPVILEIA